MYMQPVRTFEAALPARAMKPKGLKLAAGFLFVLLGLALAALWIPFATLWVVAAACLRTLGAASRFGRDTLTFAGEIVIGR